MDGSNITTPSVAPPEPRKYSKLGKASFWIGILTPLIVVFTICMCTFLALIKFRSIEDLGMPEDFARGFAFFVFFLAVPLLLAILLLSSFSSLVGVGLGMGALLQKKQKTLYGILGLILNLGYIFLDAIVFLIICLYFISLFTH